MMLEDVMLTKCDLCTYTQNILEEPRQYRLAASVRMTRLVAPCAGHRDQNGDKPQRRLLMQYFRSTVCMHRNVVACSGIMGLAFIDFEFLDSP